MLGVNTNVSVIWGYFSIPIVAPIGVQCVKMSPVEHVTCDH